MPAKKKQTTVSGKDADPQQDEIQALADRVFTEAGITGKERKEQEKAIRKATLEFRAQQEAYIRQQYIAERLQTHAIEQEIKVANRTQDPVVDVPLEKQYLSWRLVAPGKWVRYEQFTPEYMEPIMKMFAEELPEPYSAFTYEHFLSGWPILGILLFGHEGETAPETETKGGALIGSIVSKISWKYPQNLWRGYIAMLAVRPKWRGNRLGQRLVKVTVEVMKKKNASEVVLETPVTNERALKLYTDMGFAKTKYLTRYYLDGSDAIRLKLWFQSPRE